MLQLSLMEQLSVNWLLIFLGLAAVLVELFVGVETGFDLVLIGIALVLGGLVGNWWGNWQAGVTVAILLSFAYIFFGRKFVKSRLAIATKSTNIDKLIGRKALVIKDITPDEAGKVKINSEVWRAEGEKKFNQGQRVKVVSIEGVTLKVEKVV